MGHFDNCQPEERLHSEEAFLLAEVAGLLDTHNIWDWDQRRYVAVGTAETGKDEEFLLHSLARNIDHLLPETVHIQVNAAGDVLTQSSNIIDDATRVPWYPSIESYPSDTPVVYRRELTETKRLGVQVDLVDYRTTSGQNKRAAFKYYMNVANIAAVWHEANCLLRIPPHPNIVPLDRLVVEKLEGSADGDDQVVVVGFTTDYISGGTLQDNMDRTFKLQHLRQLIDVVDYLNLTLGISHGDIVTYNLLIDAKTDTIQLFDWNYSSRIGWEGDEEYRNCFGHNLDRDDVKYTAFTLYEIITQDFHIREENYPSEFDMSMIMNQTWIRHEEVQLDADVAEYRSMLEEWIQERAQIDNTTGATCSNPITWPNVPDPTHATTPGVSSFRDWRSRVELVKEGRPYVKWQRPSSKRMPLPDGQRLLATGQIIDNNTGQITDTESTPTDRTRNRDEDDDGVEGSVEEEHPSKKTRRDSPTSHSS